jgi:thiol-disulfide isomerase/thioredoxin
MNVDLNEIKQRTLAADEYIESLEAPFRENFLKRKQTYQFDEQAKNQLHMKAGNFVVVAFSAGWCKDCAAHIPVLALLSESAGLEARVFGGIKKDLLRRTGKWRIPPSPPEVETFKVDKLPTIIVFDRQGTEVGRIEENPKQMHTLEQELLAIMKMH